MSTVCNVFAYKYIGGYNIIINMFEVITCSKSVFYN